MRGVDPEGQGQVGIPERRFQNITEYSRNIPELPEYSGKYYGIFRNHVHTSQAVVTGQGRLL